MFRNKIFIVLCVFGFFNIAHAQEIIVKNVEIKHVQTRWLNGHFRLVVTAKKNLSDYRNHKITLSNVDGDSSKETTFNCTHAPNKASYWMSQGTDANNILSGYLSILMTAKATNKKVDLMIRDTSCNHYTGVSIIGIQLNYE